MDVRVHRRRASTGAEAGAGDVLGAFSVGELSMASAARLVRFVDEVAPGGAQADQFIAPRLTPQRQDPGYGVLSCGSVTDFDPSQQYSAELPGTPAAH